MLRIANTVKISPQEAIEKALNFFGAGGYGLTVAEKGADYIRFEGGGGGVAVTVCPTEGGTSIELLSREWDYQAREFIDKIG